MRNSADTEAVLKLFRGNRDFRAIIFAGPIHINLADVCGVLDALPQASSGARQESEVELCRADYHSESFHVRSIDPDVRNAFKAGKLYRYDIWILRIKEKTRSVFMLSAPFTGLMRELCKKIHGRRHMLAKAFAGAERSFVYIKPSLDRLVASLAEAEGKLLDVTVDGANFKVDGDTSFVTQLTLRGSDVVRSALYRHIGNFGEGLKFELRRLQVSYQGWKKGEFATITFDRFGNYSIEASEAAGNLPAIIRFYSLLAKRRLVEEDATIPIRTRDDKPLEV